MSTTQETKVDTDGFTVIKSTRKNRNTNRPTRSKVRLARFKEDYKPSEDRKAITWQELVMLFQTMTNEAFAARKTFRPHVNNFCAYFIHKGYCNHPTCDRPIHTRSVAMLTFWTGTTTKVMKCNKVPCKYFLCAFLHKEDRAENLWDFEDTVPEEFAEFVASRQQLSRRVRRQQTQTRRSVVHRRRHNPNVPNTNSQAEFPSFTGGQTPQVPVWPAMNHTGNYTGGLTPLPLLRQSANAQALTTDQVQILLNQVAMIAQQQQQQQQLAVPRPPVKKSSGVCMTCGTKVMGSVDQCWACMSETEMSGLDQ